VPSEAKDGDRPRVWHGEKALFGQPEMTEKVTIQGLQGCRSAHSGTLAHQKDSKYHEWNNIRFLVAQHQSLQEWPPRCTIIGVLWHHIKSQGDS
jgi:hypothetical protein